MRYNLILVLALIFTCTLHAQDQYANILAEYYSQDEPGAAAIVAKGDQILYKGAIGKAEMELDVDVKPEHIFRLGSITKQFTAVAILMLQEEGKLHVSDPMTKYLPDYPVGDHTITVEHLLTHTSGIQSYTDIPGFMQSKVFKDRTVDELIAEFSEMPMNFAPGDEWRYNNSGYVLLGKIIEVASGETYEQFIEGRIFKPLGMNDSYYDHNHEIIPNRIPGYSTDAGGNINKSHYLSMSLPYAAGSLISSVDDLLKWNTAVMKGELVSADLMETAFQEYLLNDGSPCGYGYGWSISKIRGLTTYEHGGGIFGFVTQGTYVPSQDVYVAVLTNTDGKSPAGAARRMAALASGVSLEFGEYEVDPAVLQDYGGVYAIEGSDEKRVVTISNGILHTQRNDGAVFPVVPYARDKFYYQDSRTTLEFDRNDNGEIQGQTVTTAAGDAGYAVLTDEKVPEKKITKVDVSVLENYVGVYELMEGFDITVTIVDEQLQAQATGQGPLVLEAYSDTEFRYPPAGIRMVFPEEGEGMVPHFVLFQGGQEIKATRK